MAVLYYFVKYILGPFILLFVRPVVYGFENLRIKGKAIVVSNHLSMLDPVLIALITPRPIHFMAKAELFKSGFGRIIFSAMLAFPVNRKEVDLNSLKRALRVLDKNKIFGIFPEGTRSVTNDMDVFEKGAAFLAVRSGAPVVPVYIHHSSYRTLRPKIMVGKPINISDIVANTNKSTLIDVVTYELADAINALKIELEAVHCV
jgi:1-acyl-sn-glycerol-3-phosphate acyltransferase